MDVRRRVESVDRVDVICVTEENLVRPGWPMHGILVLACSMPEDAPAFSLLRRDIPDDIGQLRSTRRSDRPRLVSNLVRGSDSRSKCSLFHRFTSTRR
jgi:hypothetical protein